MNSFRPIAALLIIVAVALTGACSTAPSDNARSSGDPDPAVRSTGGGGY